MIGNLDQEFSNFFPHVPPFFVAASVYHFKFPETLFHNTRNRNFMCRWNMHSLHSYYNYYSNYTTTVSARCDCYYFRYWIPTSKFFLLAIILLFSLACDKIQLSTCHQLYHLASAIVPPVVRVPQFEKGWYGLHVQIYIQNLFVIHQLCSSKFRSIADATCTCTAAVWLLLSLWDMLTGSLQGA